MALALTRSSRIDNHFTGCSMEELTEGSVSPQQPAQVHTSLPTGCWLLYSIKSPKDLEDHLCLLQLGYSFDHQSYQS